MLIDYIKSDLCRYVGIDKVNIINFIRHYLFNPGFKFSFWLRVCRFSNSKFLKFIAKVQHYRFRRKYMLDIPVCTNIGYGLYIGHGYAIVINGSAILGNNINLSQFTTIGSNHNKAAVIGDNVYIGPNVCIVENVIIGKNVKIGAGAVVTRDIPDNATSAGVPANVLKIDVGENNYVNKRWETVSN
ncbi:serine acetyltransferase [Vibrio renipiscarius]|uniref:Serine acetyltransferase n=1 Tax=Vibrio renipiscarius TaxID=1461322 RepID=A0A0C2NNA1_9VIBR|nr:serine acetyltransferase [Vibrio renipiscarius]KII81684.1 serine acetyltransferase [Vibrio renipiscarius]